MTCAAWLEPISAAADGELDGREAAALDRHLAGCPACRDLADRFSTMRRSLLVGSPVDVPDLEHLVVAQRTEELEATRTLRRRGLAALVSAAAIVALAVGVTGPSPTPSAPGGEVAGSPSATRVVRTEATTFSAPTVRVAAGTSVEWLNDSGTKHHLVRQVGGTTLAQDLEPGQAEVVTFDDPGAYAYWCSIHDGMTGRVLVES